MSKDTFNQANKTKDIVDEWIRSSSRLISIDEKVTVFESFATSASQRPCARKIPLALVIGIHSSLVDDTANKPYVTRDRRDRIKEMRMRLAIEYSIGVRHFRCAHSVHSPRQKSAYLHVCYSWRCQFRCCNPSNLIIQASRSMTIECVLRVQRDRRSFSKQ